MLRDLTFDDRRLDSYKERQIVDLAARRKPTSRRSTSAANSKKFTSTNDALAKVKDYLFKRGITPDNFPVAAPGQAGRRAVPGPERIHRRRRRHFFWPRLRHLERARRVSAVAPQGSPRFLAIQAASGAGKSSYLRAGLWPRLCRDPDSRRSPSRPAARHSDRTRRARPQARAAIVAAGRADQSRRHLHPAHGGRCGKGRRGLRKLMATAAEQAHEQRRIGDPERATARSGHRHRPGRGAARAGKRRGKPALLVLVRRPDARPAGGRRAVRLVDGARRQRRAAVSGDRRQKLEVPKTCTLLPLPRTSYRDVIRQAD